MFLVIALALNAAANLLMKVGSNIQKSTALPVDASPWGKILHFLNLATIAGIVLFAANVLFYRRALDGIPISVAYPVMVSVGLIFVTLAAVMLPILNERLSAWQVVGMVLIAAGVWLVAR